MRSPHRGPCRRTRRAYQLLPEPWVLRGADLPDGSSPGAGEGAHGHVHRAGHPLLQIQTNKDERASGALLVPSQYSQGQRFVTNLLLSNLVAVSWSFYCHFNCVVNLPVSCKLVVYSDPIGKIVECMACIRKNGTFHCRTLVSSLLRYFSYTLQFF